MADRRTTGALCGCTIVETGGFYRIEFCPKHKATPELYVVLDKALQEYMSSHQIFADTLRDMAQALALVDGDSHE